MRDKKGSMTIVAQGVAFRSAVGHTTTTSVRISATLKRKKRKIPWLILSYEINNGRNLSLRIIVTLLQNMVRVKPSDVT